MWVSVCLKPVALIKDSVLINHLFTARGVVWEETIIMLPDKVHFVFLSATIPNAMQFAEWICKIHAQPCHVVYTDYRPTPLQHYLFPAGGNGIHLVVDEKAQFREDNFQRAISALGDKDEDGAGGGKSGKGGPKGKGRKDKSTKGEFLGVPIGGTVMSSRD